MVADTIIHHIELYVYTKLYLGEHVYTVNRWQ